MLNKCVLLTTTYINASHIYYANGHQLKQECDENLLVISFYYYLFNLFFFVFLVCIIASCQRMFVKLFHNSLQFIINFDICCMILLTHNNPKTDCPCFIVLLYTTLFDFYISYVISHSHLCFQMKLTFQI